MEFKSFEEFYPFYLTQHKDPICRQLHFTGTLIVLVCLFFFLLTLNWLLLFLMPIAGYGFAWIGHFFFEKNKPATFQYPLYSLMGDFMMFKDMIMGKVPF